MILSQAQGYKVILNLSFTTLLLSAKFKLSKQSLFRMKWVLAQAQLTVNNLMLAQRQKTS
jgi:hypothetical protein